MHSQRNNRNTHNTYRRLVEDAVPAPEDIVEMSGTDTDRPEKIMRGLVNAAIVSAIPTNPVTAALLGVSRIINSQYPSPEIGPPLIADPKTLGEKWINLEHNVNQIERYAAISIATVPARFIDTVAESLFQMGKNVYHATEDDGRQLVSEVEDIAKKAYGIITDYAPFHLHRMAVETFVGPMGYLPALVEMSWRRVFATESTDPGDHLHHHDHRHTHEHSHTTNVTHEHSHTTNVTHEHSYTTNITQVHTDPAANRELMEQVKIVKDHLVLCQKLESHRLKLEHEKQTRMEWIGSAARLQEASTRAGFKEVAKWAGAARAGLEIHHAVRSLQTMGTVTMAAAAPCFLNIVSAGLMLMSMLDSDDSNDGLGEAFSALFQQLEYVSRQVENLRWEMHDRFDQLEYGIRASFNQLFHFLRRNRDLTHESLQRVTYDTSIIQKKIDFVAGLVRYSFDQTILLELSRSLYRLESGRAMDDKTFSSTMETLEYWILRTPGLEVFNGSILYSEGVSSEQLSQVSDPQSMLGYLVSELRNHGIDTGTTAQGVGALRLWLEITGIFVSEVEKSKGRYDDLWAIEAMIRQAKDLVSLLRVLTSHETITSYHRVFLSAHQSLDEVLKNQVRLISQRSLEDLALERQAERDRIQMLGPHKNRNASGSGDDYKRYVNSFDDILGHQETSRWGPVFVMPAEKQKYDFYPVPLVVSKLGILANIPKTYRQAVKLGLGKISYEYTIVGGNTVCVAHRSSNRPMPDGRSPTPFYPWGHSGSIQSGSVGEYLGNSIGDPTIELVVQAFYTPVDGSKIKIGHYVATGYHQHHPHVSSDAMSQGAYAIVQAFHQHPPAFHSKTQNRVVILRWFRSRSEPPTPVNDHDDPVVPPDEALVEKVAVARQNHRSHRMAQVEASPEWIHHKEILEKRVLALRWLRELAGYGQTSIDLANPSLFLTDYSDARGESAGEMVIGRLSELENLLTTIEYRRQNCFTPSESNPQDAASDPLESASREDLVAMVREQNKKIDAIYQMFLTRQ